MRQDTNRAGLTRPNPETVDGRLWVKGKEPAGAEVFRDVRFDTVMLYIRNREVLAKLVVSPRSMTPL